MIPSSAIPSIFDAQSLARLKTELRHDDPQALKSAARQFEAVFLQMVLKSMRAATPQDGPFESDQTRFYQELLDAQLAQVMASRGGTGLAAALERQLAPAAASAAGASFAYPLDPPARALPLPGAPAGLPLPPAAVASHAAPGSEAQGTAVQDFAARMWPHALAASRATGLPPAFLIAQAGLESGWGRAAPRGADGRQSFNLFGIKAGSTWTGGTVEAPTREFVAGVETRRIERFRAYASHAESFADYARLLTQNPRYAEVLASRDAAAFAAGLQRAGYASDPAYADKLTRAIATLGTATTASSSS